MSDVWALSLRFSPHRKSYLLFLRLYSLLFKPVSQLHLVFVGYPPEEPHFDLCVEYLFCTVLLAVKVVLLQSTTIFTLLSGVPTYFAEVTLIPRVKPSVVLRILMRPLVMLVSLTLKLEDVVAHVTLVECHPENLLFKLLSLLRADSKFPNLSAEAFECLPLLTLSFQVIHDFKLCARVVHNV